MNRLHCKEPMLFVQNSQRIIHDESIRNNNNNNNNLEPPCQWDENNYINYMSQGCRFLS